MPLKSSPHWNNQSGRDPIRQLTTKLVLAIHLNRLMMSVDSLMVRFAGI
jgi:hypothetical protein